MESKVILKAEHITKQFPGVKALSDVSLEVREHEVLALLGENGAGKSTLIKILAGVQPPNSGDIYVDGEKVRFPTPVAAQNAGIAVVYQELANVSELTVAENLFIKGYGQKNHTLNWKQIYAEAEKIVAEVDLKIDVHKQMGLCTVAEKQQIEIARALYENARVLILDEPTSALNDKEIHQLLENIKKLKSRGVGIVLITHKMDEIFAVSDRVTILRDGVSVAQKEIQDITEQELIRLMVGREIKDMYPDKNNHPGDVLLKVSNLHNRHVHDVSFELKKGEILGVYGLMGSGHLELGKTLFGCYPATRGDVVLNGRKVRMSCPKQCLKDGFAFVPSERKAEGLVQIQSVWENIMTAYYENGKNGWLVRRKKESGIVEKWIRSLSVKTPGPYAAAATLSGGNQQKVVLAKWLEISPEIIIMNEPTRGIDVGSKSEIYKLLNELCGQGVSIIMITSEMPELLAMSDHVIVMHEHRVQAAFSKDQLTETNIMTAAIGG
ncbi:MAG: sugar ABC transporter ATP-binding protein [Lachnospiraceae bacterium]|jgi:ABC-type sugar transport system ATPase subunit|uniref:sugar ABC transporter ATP-binding protein n=1 Tax=Candidatus Merdisoma sp. JLR.KK006 TaxID=3112626 RepID=UPI002FF2F86D|nr:sugar ABC transporter ATP-binding protein [Lachnospiraceae bacterium]